MSKAHRDALRDSFSAATTISARPSRTRMRRKGSEVAPPLRPEIALRSIDGHITRTDHEVYAWYRLDTQRWSFRSDADRERLITTIAGQYAELQGRWLHLRVTSSPYPIRAWAESHVRNSVGRPDDVHGTLSYDDYMVGEQEQLAGGAMSDKEVYLGIQVRTRNIFDRVVDIATPVLRKIAPDALDAELTALDSEISTLDGLVAGDGLRGQPATAQDMRWLLVRSCTLGLPASSKRPAAPEVPWHPEDFAAVTDLAELSQEPYAPTVTVHGKTGPYAEIQRHVAVLSLGLMEGLHIPEDDEPWMQRADRLITGVEWSARIYVQRHDEVSGRLRKQTSRINAQAKHYIDDHGLEPPQSLGRQQLRVSDIDDDMSHGFTALATRVQSWWRVAVSGETRREALTRARELAELYKPKISIEHPEAQYRLAREFIPGEPLATRKHLRRGDVMWAASAVPSATADVGDRRGILLGETATATRRPVAWDPWMSQEIRDNSGLTAMVAGLGGGKSFLGGGIVYKTLRAGAYWTVLDPSGPLARLCDLPELRPYARRINLLNAQPGILNPYRVVPEPRWEDFRDDPTDEDPTTTFGRERANLAATRRRLVLDVLTGLLPYEVARMPETRIVLLRAVRAVGGEQGNHPAMVFDALRRDNTEYHQHAVVVADFLDEMKERIALLIPEPGADPYTEARDDRLTVFTMSGLTLPRDGVSREHWTDAEAVGVEFVNLAAWLTQRSVYERPKDLRKGVWIDEAFFLSEVPTGRVLMNRFARDSRKWNVRVLLSSQVPADFLKIEGFVSLVDSVFVGRLDDAHAQTEALRLLKVPEGVGYEDVIASLGTRNHKHLNGTDRDTSPRQFIFADGTGGVERIRADFSGSHLAGLRSVLDTTPGQHENHVSARLNNGMTAATLPPASSTLSGDLDILTGHQEPPTSYGVVA